MLYSDFFFLSVPRPPLYSPECIFDRLKDLQFIENGKYLGYNHPVWSRAIVLLPGMSKDYLWLYISQNRNNVSTKIHGPVEQKRNQRKVEETDSNWSMAQGPKNFVEIREVIHVSFFEWKKLGLKTMVYKDDREYEVLEPGWTEKIYAVIWKSLKLSESFCV